MQIDFLKNKKQSTGKKRVLTLRLSSEELTLIRVKAMQFCDGNVSDWMRYAALYLLPLEEHINITSTDYELQEMLGDDMSEDSWRRSEIKKDLASFARKFKKLQEKQ
jgi:hypothetical protein